MCSVTPRSSLEIRADEHVSFARYRSVPGVMVSADQRGSNRLDLQSPSDSAVLDPASGTPLFSDMF